VQHPRSRTQDRRSAEQLLAEFLAQVQTARFLKLEGKVSKLEISQAAGFRKREDGEMRRYLRRSWLKSLFPNTAESRELVRELDKRGYLREGRKGSNTHTTPLRILRKDHACYKLNWKEIKHARMSSASPRPL
jgi:hypothetical protein